MSSFSWLRNHTAIGWPRSQAQQPFPTRRVRPQLEALEDRFVPSTLKVTSTYDGGPGSLRNEIALASSRGKDTIIFDKSLLGRTINLFSELYVGKGVTIQGPGAGLLTLTTNYNWGDPWGQSTRVFEVNASRPVVLSGVTITDNFVNDQGGAILNHTTLTISGCDISNNGAGSFGGGIANLGTMTVSGCAVSNDSAMNGGGIYNAGTMTVTNCTLALDRASGFIDLGDGIYNTSTLKVSASTFIWDSVSGPYTDGGGNVFSSAKPQIGSLTASPNPVTLGNNLTLTASNISDANPNSTIAQVVFYGFSTSTSGELGFLGYFTQTSPGVWSYAFSAADWGLSQGTITLYALVEDNYGVFSVTTTTVVVI